MITLSPSLKLRSKLQLSVRSVLNMLLQFVAMYIFVGTDCMGNNLSKVRRNVP